MTDWQNDPLFHSSETDPPDRTIPVASSSPAIRLSIHSLLEIAQPMAHFDLYQDLFILFRPILQERAERLFFVESPGRKEHKRKTIKPGDWEPLELMRAKAGGDPRYFGFYFHSGFIDYHTHDPDENTFDKGPTRFLFWIANSEVQIDITIPLEDFQNGRLDMARYRQRGWDVNSDETEHFLLGINWLTWVGEPFLSLLGGAEAISAGLPPDIRLCRSKGQVMFQLGDRPISGRRGVDDDLLPLYLALGQRLAPGRANPPRLIPAYKRGFGDLAPEGFNAAYLNRFHGSDWFGKFFE